MLLLLPFLSQCFPGQTGSEGGTHTLPTSLHSLLSPEQQEAGPSGCAALCFLKVATTLKEFAVSQWPHEMLLCPESQRRAPSTGLSSGQV